MECLPLLLNAAGIQAVFLFPPPPASSIAIIIYIEVRRNLHTYGAYIIEMP